MRALTLGLLALAASNAFAKPSHERKPRRYAVRAIRVAGNATDEEKAALPREVGNALEFVIVANNRDDLVRIDEQISVENAHPRLKGCLEPRCIREFADVVRAERVLWIDITRAGPPGPKADWKVAVSQFAVDSLRHLGVAELPCHQCTRDELLRNFNLFLDPLFTNEPPSLPLCHLKVVSQPSGATVLLDSIAMGETPFEHSLAAGTHKVSVEKEGFARAAGEVECVAQAKEKLLLALGSAATPSAVPRREGRSRRSLALEIVGGVLLGLGAAGIIAGAVDLSLDGKGTCALAPGHAQCQQLYDTGREGAALVGAGAAAAVGGIIALVIDGAHSRARLSADLGVARWGARIDF